MGLRIGGRSGAAGSTRFPLKPGGLPTSEGIDVRQRSIGEHRPIARASANGQIGIPLSVFFNALPNMFKPMPKRLRSTRSARSIREPPLLGEQHQRLAINLGVIQKMEKARGAPP
jgi:hypothetical protein